MNAIAAPKPHRYDGLPLELQIALIRRDIAADRKLQKKANQWEKEHGFKNALKVTGLISEGLIPRSLLRQDLC